MPQVPFTAHIRVVPARGKRMEYWRDLQKIATLAYTGLSGTTNINIAQPGGGQHQSFGQFSGLTNGMATKPRIGQTPAQLMITGFYNVSRNNIQPHPTKHVIHAGSHQTGTGNHPYDANPMSTISNEVATLRSTIETEVDAALPSGVEFSIVRIDYSGVIYGHGGYHFPQ